MTFLLKSKKPFTLLLKSTAAALILISGPKTIAQVPKSSAPDSTLIRIPKTVPENKVKLWYEKIALRGYVQVRYNRLLETNKKFTTEYDKSVGDEGGFLIRRARLVLSGTVHDRVYFYFQPDFASTPSSSSAIHFTQIRDAYFDLFLNKNKTYRFRIGQSKIPFGFENLQSSQNRLTLDRNDALNSALPNERDLGIIFYWAPEKIRQRFSELGNATFKGSGDYGVFGLGFYNGQTANKPEVNNNRHLVTRLAYPFQFENGQIIEPGIQAYTGYYSVEANQVSSLSVIDGKSSKDFLDRRVAGTLVLYPKPIGFQTEFNVGEGPQYDAATGLIKVKKIHGGYAQVMYRHKTANLTLIPFVKVQYYHGGKKNELDARFNEIYETEIGMEWQPFTNFELVAHYTISDRLASDGRKLRNHQNGNLLRLQAQVNF